MIPPKLIFDALKAGGWHAQFTRDVFFVLMKNDLTIHGRRDRWRHTTGRAFRGDALTRIFRNQREIVSFIEEN